MTPDPAHTDAVARHAAGPNPPAIPGPSWLAAQAIHEQHLRDFLDSTDPAVHAAMLDALTRHGVLVEVWRWKEHGNTGPESPVRGWIHPPPGADTQRRLVTPWEVTR